MAGNKESGKKTAATNKRKYGADYYSRIGRIGGRNGKTDGFANGKVDPSEAGKLGYAAVARNRQARKEQHDT